MNLYCLYVILNKEYTFCYKTGNDSFKNQVFVINLNLLTKRFSPATPLLLKTTHLKTRKVMFVIFTCDSCS